MSNEIKINELIEHVQKFCEDRDWDQFHNQKELAIGISTEAAELLQMFRFKDEEQMKKMMNDDKYLNKIKEELADVLFFVLRFAQMNHIDLEEALVDKIEKNGEKYPIDKVKGKNHKYNEYE